VSLAQSPNHVPPSSSRGSLSIPASPTTILSLASKKRLWVILTFVLLSLLLSACAPPRPAPVVSREIGHQPRLAPKPGFVRVGSGDTIYSIAWRHGLDPRELASWNGIRAPYRIYPGHSLRVTSPPPGRRVVRNQDTGRAVVHKAVPSVSVRKMQIRNKPKVKTASKKRTAKQKKIVYKKKLRWQWPTDGKVRVRFKRGDPSRKGIVLSGRLGQGVKAAEDGTVVYSGSGLIGYGKLLIIKHNKNYLSAYGHNKKLLVKEGDQVKKGTRIAEMGTSGSGKIVLHFEIRRNGVPVNPLPLLPRKS